MDRGAAMSGSHVVHADLTVRILDGHEQREVVQPARLRAAETIEPILHRAAAGGIEAIERPRPERPAMGDDGGEVDVARLEDGSLRASVSVSKPSSISRSRLMSSGLPAKAEKHWYGESP